MPTRKVVIMGAAGRDFHDFNTAYRGDRDVRVVAFTATQIPDIAGRRYPPSLAGEGYPEGIPIHPESELDALIREHGIDEVVFAYSDVSHEYVMQRASVALAAGATFSLLGPRATMLRAEVPVVSVGAVRTGAGKSQTSRRIASILRDLGWRVVVVRHPMPYGDLERQVVQRFQTFRDLDRAEVTIEEREEYEPHLRRGTVVYAGVDYARVLEAAQREADVILWDGGNNDFPFFHPDLHVVVADPHRPGHERTYYPGEANARMADVIIINKVDTADPAAVRAVRQSLEHLNPRATVIEAASPIQVEGAEAIRGKRVVVVEDGPTLTHGGMPYGAGVVAARVAGAAEIVDPRPYAVGSIREAYAQYPHLDLVLPAMGYGRTQIEELEATLAATPAEVIVIGTPVDLRGVLRLNKPAVRVTYELEERTRPDLADILGAWSAERRRG